jgi:hypothetical protein
MVVASAVARETNRHRHFRRRLTIR